MKDFKFNTLYIIESLKDGELKTGKKLYEDMKLQEFVHDSLRVEYCPVPDGKNWDKTIDDILFECENNGILPIIHLEVHGWEEGIELMNGEQRSIEIVGDQLRKINIATGCNLFITMGICMGLYVLFNTHLDRPMPFCGAIGSFDEMQAGDIQLRYAEFYRTFFNTFDITKAYIQLMKTETGAPIEYTHYRYIHIDEVFYRAYMNYVEKGCAPEGMKQRALDAAEENGIDLPNRQQRRKFQRDFKKEEHKTRDYYYQKAATTFFMLDVYPENKQRFNVPDTCAKLEQRCKNIVTI